MFFLAFVLFMLFSNGKLKRDNKSTGTFKSVMLGMLILMIFAEALETFVLSVVPLTAFGYLIYKLVKNKKRSDRNKEEYGWDPHRWDKEQGNPGIYQKYREYKRENPPQRKFTSLPTSVKKRRKIVEDFNEKYNLCLTQEQIKSIVDSTYMSEIWRKEVEAMNQKYNVVHEWFRGYSSYLRVYMYVFHVQEITSDISQQESICMYAFEEVFAYADQFPNIPVSEKIAKVNEKFFTSFDDITFMLAYRFMESKGKKHNLGKTSVVRDGQELDDLLDKYKTGEQSQ